jgi:peptide/nickel transport system substrate-binding protein
MKKLAAALLTGALLLAGCSRAGAPAAQDTGALRILIVINPTQLNAILPENTSENFIDGLIYSELVTIDAHGNDVPDLAAVVPTQANGGISKDGLTITYHLRPNAVWHDGVPVTSADVKYTWQQVMNPRNNTLTHHGYDEIASIDTPDSHTVVMHMKRVFPPAIDTIFGESDTAYRILPKHLLSQFPNLNSIPFNAAPVGSGPYRFGRWERNDRIVLIANENYFKGAPKIKEIDLLLVPDSNTEEAVLRSGGADLALDATSSFYNNIANDPSVTRLLVPAPSWVAAIFNLKRPPLDDPAVRHAIAYAIDAGAIVKKSTYGTGTTAIADLTPFSWAYPTGLKPLPFDPARARAILERDGWRPGSDGIRAKNGTRLSLQLVFGLGSQTVRNIAAQLQQNLRDVGIDLQLRGYEYQMLYSSVQTGGILNSGKFDIAFYSWVAGADPDNSSQWLCAMAPPAGNNVAHYCNPAMDAAQAKALSTFDRPTRKAAYRTIEELLLSDLPAVFLYDNPRRDLFITGLQNFTPNGVSEGWNAYEWNR